MSRRRTSQIWKIEKQLLEEIVANNNSYKGILAYFGLENKGENFRTLKKRLIEDAISFDHLLKHGENLKALQSKNSTK
jgi:transposase